MSLHKELTYYLCCSSICVLDLNCECTTSGVSTYSHIIVIYFLIFFLLLYAILNILKGIFFMIKNFYFSFFDIYAKKYFLSFSKVKDFQFLLLIFSIFKLYYIFCSFIFFVNCNFFFFFLL